MNESTKALFSVPLLVRQTDIQHMAIEHYVRDKLCAFDDYTSYHNNDFNQSMKDGQPFRAEMEAEMLKVSQDFLISRNIPKDRMNRARVGYWYSMYDAGDDHHLHTHPGALCAGTYYPYTDKSSACIRFRNPCHTLINMVEPWLLHSLEYAHMPITGQMLVWPSWLEHEVRSQNSVEADTQRIAISWNYQ